MRLLHPKTLRIVACQCTDTDFESATVSRKQVISHAWSEVFKFMASGKPHPKMFIQDEFVLGFYAGRVFEYGIIAKNNLKASVIGKYSEEFIDGFTAENLSYSNHEQLNSHFDDMYLFSDACSLYFKGLNIFPYIFGDQWRKFVPVQSHQEIHRQVTKTLKKEA